MNHLQVNPSLKEYQGELKKIGAGLQELARRFGADEATRQTIQGQLDHLKENFLFVIVGEVNIGKSSFVNSLLEAPICATSSAICTQDVQKISYGPEESTEKDAVHRIENRTYPAEILKTITIVDTPGTNSRTLEHQIITERFVPHSNLIVFVFLPTNIHVESAWELFRKIKQDWRKKIVFVLTQADRYRPEEMEDYLRQLENYAREEGIQNPTIFATSAYLEEQGDKEKSGYRQVRTYINEQVLGTAAVEKIRDHVTTFQSLLGNLNHEFDLRKEKYEKDRGVRQKIEQLITNKETLALSNIQSLTRQCLHSYDANTEKTLQQLKSGIGFFNLTFKSIRAMFGGESTKDWLARLNQEHVENLNKDINLILEAGKDSIKSDIQYMVVGVKDELDQWNELRIRPSEMFAQLDEKRNELVHALKANLTDFVEKSPVFNGQAILKGDLDYSGVNVAGGVAAIGTALAVISQASVLDITGGIATALGLLVAGGLATTQKSKYIKSVQATLDTNREKLSADLSNNLKSYFDLIKTQIHKQFAAFDHHLDTEAAIIASYEEGSRQIKNQLLELERKV